MKRGTCLRLGSSWEEPNKGTSSVPTWPGFQTAEDLIIIWLFISLRISASGDPPMWAGTLGLEPSPNLLFHWARETLCSPWWKLGGPVTRDPQPAHPTVRVCRHSPSHTHKAALAKSSSKEGTGGLREWPKNTLVHRLNLVTMGSRRLSFFLTKMLHRSCVCLQSYLLWFTRPQQIIT